MLRTGVTNSWFFVVCALLDLALWSIPSSRSTSTVTRVRRRSLLQAVRSLSSNKASRRFMRIPCQLPALARWAWKWYATPLISFTRRSKTWSTFTTRTSSSNLASALYKCAKRTWRSSLLSIWAKKSVVHNLRILWNAWLHPFRQCGARILIPCSNRAHSVPWSRSQTRPLQTHWPRRRRLWNSWAWTWAPRLLSTIKSLEDEKLTDREA